MKIFLKFLAVVTAVLMTFAGAAHADNTGDTSRDALATRLVQVSFHTENYYTMMDDIFETMRPRLREIFSNFSDDQFQQFLDILAEELTVELKRLEGDLAALYVNEIDSDDMRAVIEAFESGKTDKQVNRTKAGKKWRKLRRAHLDDESQVIDAWQATIAQDVTVRAFARARAEIETQ